MSRPLRILFPGAWYHVMNRGLRRQAIFRSKEDHLDFLALVHEAREVWGIHVAGYCLMTNHYHLLLQTPDPNLPRIMRHINGVYTQRFNARHGFDGPLFRGRYKAVLIDPQGYLPEVVRYIHRNPMRAGLEKGLGRYPWSSHGGYLSNAKRWSWLSKDVILSMLSRRKKERRKAYVAFMKAKEPDSVKRFYSLKNLRSVLGSSAFVQQIKDSFADALTHPEVPQSSSLKRSVDDVLLLVAREFDVPVDALLLPQRGRPFPARDVALVLAHRHTGETLTAVAAHFGMARHSSGGNALRRVGALVKKDRRMARTIEKLDRRLRSAPTSSRKGT